MLLVVDVGNTNITLGVFDGEELSGTFRMTTKLPRTSDEYGIEPAAAAVAVAGPAAGGDAAAADEGKSEYDVVLKDAGAQKIAVIKAVKEATGLGLADAKKAVEAMGVIKEAMPKADAEALVAKLKENGATAELK